MDISNDFKLDFIFGYCIANLVVLVLGLCCTPMKQQRDEPIVVYRDRPVLPQPYNLPI